MQWYYAVNNQQVGPVEQDVLVALIRDGKVKGDDLVWNTGMGNQWVKASKVPELGFMGAGMAGGAVPPPVTEWSDSAVFVSQTPNRDLMAQARECLRGNWGLGVVVILVNGLLGMLGMIPVVGVVISLLITGPLTLGLTMVFLSLARSEGATLGMLFDGFKRFGSSLGVYLLSAIFVFLWALLLIVPGIMASIAYSMAFFILRDDPTVDAMDAIRRSKIMMMGNKWKYFCLQWRFLGWALLCILTFGIGFLWLGPYVFTSMARFYEDLKEGQKA